MFKFTIHCYFFVLIQNLLAATSCTMKNQKKSFLLIGYKNNIEYLRNNNFSTSEIREYQLIDQLKKFNQKEKNTTYNIEGVKSNIFEEKQEKNFFMNFKDTHINLFFENTNYKEKIDLKNFCFNYNISEINEDDYKEKHIKVFLTYHLIQLIILYYEKNCKNNPDQNSFSNYFFFNIFYLLNERDIRIITDKIMKNFREYKNNYTFYLNTNIALLNFFTKDDSYNQLFDKFITKIFEISRYRFMRMYERKNIVFFLNSQKRNENTELLTCIEKVTLRDKSVKKDRNFKNEENYENFYYLCNEKMNFSNIITETYNYVYNTNLPQTEYTVFFDLNNYFQNFSTINVYLLDLQQNIHEKLQSSLYVFIRKTLELTIKHADNYNFNYSITEEFPKFFENLHKNINFSNNFSNKRINVILGIDKYANLYEILEIFMDQKDIIKSSYFNPKFYFYIITLNLLRHKFILYTSHHNFNKVGSKYFDLKDFVHYEYAYINNNHQNYKNDLFKGIEFENPYYLNILVNDICDVTKNFFEAIFIDLFDIDDIDSEKRGLNLDKKKIDIFFESMNIKKLIHDFIFRNPTNTEFEYDYDNFFFEYLENNYKNYKGLKILDKNSNTKTYFISDQNQGTNSTKEYIKNFLVLADNNDTNINKSQNYYQQHNDVYSNQKELEIEFYNETSAIPQNFEPNPQLNINQYCYEQFKYLGLNQISNDILYANSYHNNIQFMNSNYTNNSFEIQYYNDYRYNLFLSTNPIDTSNHENPFSEIVSQIYFDYNNFLPYYLDLEYLKKNYPLIGIMKFPYEFEYNLSSINYKMFIKKQVGNCFFDIPLVFEKSKQGKIQMTKIENIYSWNYPIEFYAYNVNHDAYEICY
ncbi:hypothetical protein GVAV_000765 [Gurleya vavrai]